MIINADDFGYSESVNKAIFDCFKKGYINRTTIMVNMPYAEDAARLAKEGGFFARVGLHINLTEGKALTQAARSSDLCDENGYFKGVFHKPVSARLYLNKKISDAISVEVEAQIKRFLAMGFTLMHADSHNYTHVYFSVYKCVKPLLVKYGFTSVRISRNIPPKDFSPLFKVYKTIFNHRIKKLKINGSIVNTTDYFGSVQDFMMLDDKSKYKDSIEFMTHPNYEDGVLIDNTLPNPHPFKDEKWLEENNLKLDNNGKLKLLVTFIQTHIGGAMTALVNFLNALDTDKYDVDVVFYTDDRKRHGIKESINILPQGRSNSSIGIKNILMKITSPVYIISRIKEIYYKKCKKNVNRAVQIMSKQGCKYDLPPKKEYDIAVAFEFSWAIVYAMEKVKARKKLCWFHIDFDEAGYSYKLYEDYFKRADALMFVSEECRQKFVNKYPIDEKKTHFMPNLLTSDYIKNKGEEKIELPFTDNNYFKFVSIARVNFNHKGFDRAARVFARLKADGLLDDVKWIVVGEGRESDEFEKMVVDFGLSDIIYTVGTKINPIPYLKQADAFLLPSRFEGKPMVITEAFIMGVVPVVTEYASAKEQIRSGIDGLVFENSEEGLYEGLKNLLQNKDILKPLKENVQNTNYGNEDEISVFDKVMEELTENED